MHTLLKVLPHVAAIATQGSGSEEEEGAWRAIGRGAASLG